MVTFFVVLTSLLREWSFKHAGDAGFLILLGTCLLCVSVGRVDGKWRWTRALCVCVMLGKCGGLGCAGVE